MRTLWVIVLSTLALVIGAFGGLTWKGATTSLDGIHIACEVINVAEKSNLMTKQQVQDTVDRMLKRVEKGGRADVDNAGFAKELKSGCPTFAKLGRKE